MTGLQRGAKGDRVCFLQALLCLAGVGCRPIDGDFGGGTERAVKAYQTRQRLPVTGIADAETQHALGMDKADPTKTPKPVIGRIDVDTAVGMFAPSVPRRNIEVHLPHVLEALAETGLDDRDLALTALATIRAETSRFVPVDEGISKFNTTPGAHPFDRYDNRGDLGNRGRPDGALYKGRGFIQLTGRANYRRIGELIGVGSQLEQEPEMANDPWVAGKILAAFLAAKRSGVKYSVFGKDLAYTRKLVNGGSHGLDRFLDAFNRGASLLT